MQWIKKHSDSAVVIAAVIGATWTISGLIHGVEMRTDAKVVCVQKSIDERFKSIDDRFVALEKDIAVIKTIVTMRNNSERQLAKQIND